MQSLLVWLLKQLTMSSPFVHLTIVFMSLHTLSSHHLFSSFLHGNLRLKCQNYSQWPSGYTPFHISRLLSCRLKTVESPLLPACSRSVFLGILRKTLGVDLAMTPCPVPGLVRNFTAWTKACSCSVKNSGGLSDWQSVQAGADSGTTQSRNVAELQQQQGGGVKAL